MSLWRQLEVFRPSSLQVRGGQDEASHVAPSRIRIAGHHVNIYQYRRLIRALD